MDKKTEQLESDLRAAQTDAGKVTVLSALAWRLRRHAPERSLALTDESLGIISAHAGSADPAWKKAEAESTLCKGIVCISLSQYDRAMKEIKDALAFYEELGGALAEESLRGQARALSALTSCCRHIPGYPSLLELAERALAIGRLAGDRQVEAGCLNNLGRTLHEIGNNARSAEVLREALQICGTIGEKGLEAAVLNNLGRALSGLGSLAEGLDCHLQSLALRRSIGDVAGQARSLNNVGKVYSTLGNSEKALEYFQQSLAIDVALGDRSRAAATLESIGRLYTERKDYSKALECLRRSLAMKESIAEDGGVCIVCASIGRVLCETGKCSEAVAFLLRSLELGRRLGLRTEEMRALLWLGRLHTQDLDLASSIPPERLASVLEGADPSSPSFGIRCGEMALDIAGDISNREGVSECHLLLAEIHKRTGDYAKALEHLEKHDAIKGELLGEETSRKISQLQLAFETEEARKESEILRIKNQELADLNERLSGEIENRKRSEKGRRELGHLARHAGKMRSLNTMTGNVARGFNNLLLGVLGNIESALDSLESDSPARALLQEADNAAARAAELSRLMLLYAGEGREAPEVIDLSRLVEETLEHFSLAMPGRAAVRCNLAHDLMAIHGSPAQIRQVILNLLTNSQEAIGDSNGEITVTTSAAECDRAFLRKTYLYEDQPEGSYLCLNVRDTGCGMDKETLGKIFDPFFTTKFTGRGLGLAAVLGIVRGHRGAISVTSEPGKESTFSIYFPALSHPV